MVFLHKTENPTLIWIDGHIPFRVIEFFLTDWIQENTMRGYRIGYVHASNFDQNPERQLKHVPAGAQLAAEG